MLREMPLTDLFLMAFRRNQPSRQNALSWTASFQNYAIINAFYYCITTTSLGCGPFISQSWFYPTCVMFIYIKPDHFFLLEFSLHLSSMILFFLLFPFTNTKSLVFIRELHHSFDFKSIFQVMKCECQTIYFYQYLCPKL